MQKEKIIQQGAEAQIIKIGDNVIKKRLSKSYRIKILDEKITKLRTRAEARILEKVSKIISVPKVIKLTKSEITLDYINGDKLSENLDKYSDEKSKDVCKKIGESIAKLHENNIIHGDLTTSNMIYQNAEEKLYFIDFGLSFHSEKLEDKAVDLHLIKQAIEAKHFKKWKTYWKTIEKDYEKNSTKGKETLERLKKVESRGRYKDKF